MPAVDITRNARTTIERLPQRPACRRSSLTLALTMSTALMGVCAVMTLPAVAQTAPDAYNRQMPYDISAQPLSGALVQFSSQTGTQLFFDADLVRGRTSPGVRGPFTQGAALERLLAGSGLDYRVNGNTVTIVAPSPEAAAGGLAEDGSIMLDTVTVQAANPNSTLGVLPAPYAGGQVATGGQVGMLGNRSVMNTPFSQTSYTARTIENQQARTVNDVLNTDPSVITTGTGARHDSEIIRGFANLGATGTRSLNGLSGMAPMEFPSADFVERIEVLKGPSALLNGMVGLGNGSVGGSVNLVTKRATDEPITRLTPRYVSQSQFGAHVDVGRRFGADNEFGVRVNGSFDNGETPVETQRERDALGAVNLDYTGERIRLSADLLRQSRKESPRANYVSLRSIVGTLATVPAAPDAGVSLSPTWDEGRSDSTVGMVRGEVDILDNVTAFAAFGAQSFDKDYQVAQPAVLLDATGRFSSSPWVQRSTYDIVSMQGGVRATGQTGPVDHALSISWTRSTYQEGSAFWIGRSSIINSIYDPVFGPEPTLVDPGRARKVNDTTVSGVAIADTFSILDERIQLTAGLRYQEIDSSNFNGPSGIRTSRYESDALSPAFGLVVKPWENVSLYANYIEGLQAGSTVGNLYANAGEVFAPYVSKQYEAGVKVDWGVVTTTAAVFQIAQPNAIAVPSSTGGLPTLTQDGEQENRGIELNAYGELTESIRILGGVTFIDATQKRTANGRFDGDRAEAVPKVRTVVGAEWDTPFVEGLTLTGRFSYTSSQVVVNTRPDLTLPSWHQIDIGARYEFDSPWNAEPITVRFDIDNLTDENYWVSPFSSGFLQLSQPRTFRLSTTFNF